MCINANGLIFTIHPVNIYRVDCMCCVYVSCLTIYMYIDPARNHPAAGRVRAAGFIVIVSEHAIRRTRYDGVRV